jgi:hypothetical protein
MRIKRKKFTTSMQPGLIEGLKILAASRSLESGKNCEPCDILENLVERELRNANISIAA